MARYYHEEQESAYWKIEQLGYTQWNDLFDQSGAWTYGKLPEPCLP
jgi:hypothetical protein